MLEAIAIVIALLLIFMGWRSGVLMGVILLLTILGTFIGMYLMDITLQLISLGALVLALGLLVDNAIVVTDVFLIQLQKGMDRQESAEHAVKDHHVAPFRRHACGHSGLCSGGSQHRCNRRVLPFPI